MLQPYHLEIWVEKSTMDDVLLPLCRRYHVNLVTGLGFMSITSVIGLLNRIVQSGERRVLYISDFDPAGDGMPTAVARQIEYWLAHHALESDIKLTPIALTTEQVAAYRFHGFLSKRRIGGRRGLRSDLEKARWSLTLWKRCILASWPGS